MKKYVKRWTRWRRVLLFLLWLQKKPVISKPQYFIIVLSSSLQQVFLIKSAFIKREIGDKGFLTQYLIIFQAPNFYLS